MLRDHDIPGTKIVEGEDALDHLFLIGLNGPFLRTMFRHADQLGFGNGGIGFGLHKALQENRLPFQNPCQGVDQFGEKKQWRC